MTRYLQYLLLSLHIIHNTCTTILADPITNQTQSGCVLNVFISTSVHIIRMKRRLMTLLIHKCVVLVVLIVSDR